MGMRRYYDEGMLQRYFGYSRGAYASGLRGALPPNIAIYCRTPMRYYGQETTVHVINVIGFAFDSPAQPDYMHFLPLTERKRKELEQCMLQMWLLVFECAKRKNLRRIYLADVGAGAFSKGLEGRYSQLKDASLQPVQREYPRIHLQALPRIPEWAFTDEARARCSDSLLVNAWNPWSIVGNGNAADNSLDGFFGCSTAMAVLCWPCTNPLINYESV